MGIRLLGPVELRTAAGALVPLSGSQRRAVLALLALRLGRVVPVEHFFELLWGEEPPARAKAALQGHVAALRKVLADTPFLLHTRAPGYLLTGPAEQVDVLRFEALAARAREDTAPGEQAAPGAGAEAVGLLEQALGLWTGAALADLPDTELRRALVGQLAEARTRVLISWAELRLSRGSGAAAVPALEQSVRADGLRESVVALLIRCLQQAGRPSDALTVYHHARELLDRELGMLPGADLQAALSQVLTEEPAWRGDLRRGDGYGGPAGRVHGAGAGAGAGVEARARAGARAGTEAGAGQLPTAAGAATVTPGERDQAPAPESDLVEPPTPRQLPRQSAGFVGRGLESRWLDRECGPERTGDGLALVVGPAGAGKSATVIRWAHQVAAGFPDGQLFVDLRGFDPAGPADPAEVLGEFLLALGVAESAVPEDLAARVALYRAHTDTRALLVVLDNARSAEHLTALLPSGPDCATVVTSRNTLEDLVVTEGAALLRLEALPEGDALRLLERALTPGRVHAEVAAAEQLIELCDHLPLALRIAASRLAARPDWTIADLVAELADERTRLLTLDTQGTISIRTALSLTYRHLSAEAARLLTVLAAHPGREVDTFAGAALLGTNPATARAALGELAAYHLLTEGTPGRYSRHDLIRLFGMELFAEQPAEVRRLSSERLLEYYAEAARQCSDHLEPSLGSYGERFHPPTALPRPTNARAALDWFRAEEPTIRALVVAANTADPERAWQLSLGASPLYYGASRLIDWLSCLRAGQRAAERCGSTAAAALLCSTMANALIGVDRRQEAAELAQRAVAGTTPADGFAHTRSLATLALITAALGDPAEAVRLSAAAVELTKALCPPVQLSLVLAYAAAISMLTGDAEAALREAREAQRLLTGHPGSTTYAWSMLTEAQALQALGFPEAAELVWSRLLTNCQEAGFLHLHAISEQSYATFLLALGREREAAEHLRSAVGLYQLHGHLAGAVAELLTVIEQSLSCRGGGQLPPGQAPLVAETPPTVLEGPPEPC
ncbi:AfsR/SARP family transcriptional regulator [Kitasatospora kifunensis]|uniref:DNA-binding SARP family transcriptional activator/tetratricopeptide (TPR) repeat protein n=1 Tax=Kitasatospora kifunensis TaxID=58351 RepID=A0A7W7VX35_KITKI|nr:BTAD domain-containing putative transcriptional regulator [Kitasatospora kifunensis]MBB4926056.1 DNA-binding SARP family transcriptional activator/tetratricopeptide (TPR) repeat protein [Kitasatospora kifunensis]